MFSRGLELMGSLYASATGTAVVQLKDIPQRPREFDGKVVMLPEEGLAVKELESASLAFVAESCLRKARNELARFGTVLEVEVSESSCVVEAQFSSHEEAERAIAQMTIEGHTIFAGYKTKEYDERGWW